MIQIRGRTRQSTKGIAEDRGRLTRHYAAKLDAPVLEASVGGCGGGRGAQVDGTRHAPAGREPTERPGQLIVNSQGQRAWPVYVLLDYWHPVVGEIAGQLELHARVVDRHIRRQDQRVLVALLP